MTHYDLLIIFTDGSNKIISEVEETRAEGDLFMFLKNGYWGFLPQKNVRYLGRKFDWEY